MNPQALLSGKKEDLLPALQKLADELSRFTHESGEFPEAVAKVLGNKKLVKHKDADVRLMVACCISDALRLQAPNSPFANDRLGDIFELLVSQLGGIEDLNGASYHRYVYLFERLAETKSFVLLPDGADDLVAQTFEALFKAAHPEHGKRVERHMLDILTTCIENEESVAPEVADRVLMNLVEPQKTERPAAYHLAKACLAKCTNELQRPLLAFLQASIQEALKRGAPRDEDDDEAMEEREENDEESEGVAHAELKRAWRELLIELATVAPVTVGLLLPQVESAVAINDESARVEGTELLAKLLRLGDFASSHPSLLTVGFFGRLNDVSPHVRAVAVEHAIKLIVDEPPLAAPLLTALEERVRDSSPDVRQRLVAAVGAHCYESQTEHGDSAFDAFATLVPTLAPRMGDTKTSVRTAARDALCFMYKARSTQYLTQHAASRTVPDELHCIPQQLLHCYGVDAQHDVESRIELEQLLTSKMLPQEDSLRLRAFCALHAALQPYQRRALRGLLRSKRTYQGEIHKWLELHDKMRVAGRTAAPAKSKVKSKKGGASADGDNDAAGGDDNVDVLRVQQARVVAAMCKRMPQADKAKEVWEAIGAAKDNKAHDQLRILASAGSSLSELKAAQIEWRKRIAPRLKSAHVPTLIGIGSLAAMTLLWRDGVEELLTDAAEQITADPAHCGVGASAGGVAMPLLEMLNDVAAQSPQTFGAAGPTLAAALQAACQPSAAGDLDARRKPVLLLLLRLVQAVSPQLEHAGASTRKLIVAELCKLCCTSKEVEVGKLAAQAITSRVLVPAVRRQTYEVLLTKLRASVDPSAPTKLTPSALAVLGALAKRDGAALGDESARAPLLERLLESALPDVDDDDEASSADSAKAYPSAAQRASHCSAQLLAISALANESLGSYSMGDSSSPDPTVPSEAHLARAATLVKRLHGALEVDGALGAAARATEDERALVRLAAGRALLKLVRVPALRVEAHLGTLGWHKLALLVHDGSHAVRTKFVEKIVKESKRHVTADKRETNLGAPTAYLATRVLNLPPQFTTMLALCALDPEKENVAAAKSHLVNLVGIWRACAHKWSQPRALPEVQLPWLVHTLAHHPDYEIEMGDAAGGSGKTTLPSAQRCLDFYLGACLANGANSFDLLRHVASLTMSAVDKVEPNGRQTRILGLIARKLIQHRAKGKKWSSAPVPPDLTLPALLFFKVRPDQPVPDVESYLPEGFELFVTKSGGGGGGGGATALVVHADGPKKSASKRKASDGGGAPAAKQLKAKAPAKKAGAKKAALSPARRDVDNRDESDDGDDDDDDDGDDGRGAKHAPTIEQRKTAQEAERNRRLAQRAQRQGTLVAA